MDLVIFSSLHWNEQGGAHRPTRLARALARQHQRVLFVEPQPQRPATPPPHNVEITSLLELGMSETEISRAWFGFNAAPLNELAQQLEARLARFERTTERAAIWMAPFVPQVRLLPLLARRGYRLIYDCLDDFEGLHQAGVYFGNLRAEHFLAQQAELITVVSRPLLKKLHALAPAHRIELLPDGADLEFRPRGPAPSDLARGEVTLGFWGMLTDYMVDVEALVYIARERPTWALNLIGAWDVEPGRPSVTPALRGLPNIRLLGPRSHEALQDYVTAFDVCLIPFPDNAFSRARDPIKSYEYLAGYKPIVALHTPQLRERPYLLVAETPAEFLAQIEAARKLEIDRHTVAEFLCANSWAARTEKLVSWIREIPSRSPRPTGLILEETFEDQTNVDARRQAYIAHLEHKADDRLSYARALEEQAYGADRYIKQLERMHPLAWLRRAQHNWRPRR